MIGWNGSAQAAAAVRNALPWAREERHGSAWEALPDSVQTSLLDVVAYLQGHGIDATERASINDEDAGQAILAAAEENEADIVVMGAFGRSRFNEWILGGATRDVLGSMKTPVFMAH